MKLTVNFIRLIALLGNVFPNNSKKNAAKDNSSAENATNSLDWGISNDFHNSEDIPLNSENIPSQFSFRPENQENDNLRAKDASLNYRSERYSSLIKAEQGIIENVEDPEQIKLNIESSRITRIERFRDNLRKWENIIEVLPFWRIPINPINITLSVFTTFVSAVLIWGNIFKLGNQIPLFYSQVTHSRLLIAKPLFGLIPIMIGIFQIIILRFTRNIFNFDRRLSSVISAAQTFFNIMLMIALFEIITLVLK